MTPERDAQHQRNETTDRPRVRRSEYFDDDVLSTFGSSLDVNPAMLEAIRSWAGHPELSALYDSLCAHTDPKAFLDKYAEAMVARHLLRHECRFNFDVQTPNGRSADFEVFAGGYRFFLHVKRLTTARQPRTMQSVTSRMRYLENIKRPYVVHIRWSEDNSDEMMARLLEGARDFLKRGRVGDEYVARDDANQDIGGLRIVAPWDGTHVKLVIGHPSGFKDDVGRIQKLLKKAAKQFMPGAINVVLVGSRFDSGLEDVENALLGSHIERWDEFPPKGRRIAHGRAADGFWHEGRYDDCQAGSWFKFDPAADTLTSRLWIRGHLGVPTQVMRRLIELFHSNTRLERLR